MKKKWTNAKRNRHVARLVSKRGYVWWTNGKRI
jgi:hypothetical protein